MSRCWPAAPAAILLLAGCGDDPAGPGGHVLVGRFGNPEQHVELLAVQAGIDLKFPCGAVFTSDEPILLRPDGSFRREGTWHPANIGGPQPPRDAEINGFERDEALTVSLSAEGGEGYTLELARNVSGEVDAVLCASKRAGSP